MRGRGPGPWRWLALLLFGYIVARPVSNNEILVPVLALIGALSAVTILVQPRRLAGPLVPALVVTLTFGLAGLAAGPATPGFTSGLLVFVGAPVLYWTAATAVDERMLKALFTTAAVVTVFVGGTIAVYVAQSTGSIPAVLPTWLLEQYGAGFGEVARGGADYTQTRFYGLSTLVATGPMWIASLFMRRDALLPPAWLRVAAAVAAAAGAFAGGRRALALVLVLVPLLALLFATLLAWFVRHRGSGVWVRALLKGLGAMVLLLGAGALGSGVFRAAWSSVVRFAGGDQLSADDQVRSYQADRLIDAWSQSPIVGHGFGGTIPGYWRNMEAPWVWELQYHAMIFQTGVVGVLLLLLGALLTLRALLLAARARPDLIPSLVVASCAAGGMLVGNATNPYLQAPGHVWSIFLPIAVANVMLRTAAQRAGASAAPRADDPASGQASGRAAAATAS